MRIKKIYPGRNNVNGLDILMYNCNLALIKIQENSSCLRRKNNKYYLITNQIITPFTCFLFFWSLFV